MDEQATRIAESARELEGSSNASSFSASRSENELEISPSEEWIPSDAVRDLSSHMQDVSPRPQVRSSGSRRRSKRCVDEISEHPARFTMANGAHEVKSEEFIAHQKQASGIINDPHEGKDEARPCRPQSWQLHDLHELAPTETRLRRSLYATDAQQSIEPDQGSEISENEKQLSGTALRTVEEPKRVHFANTPTASKRSRFFTTDIPRTC